MKVSFVRFLLAFSVAFCGGAISSEAFADERPPFSEWLLDIKAQALAQGVDEKTLTVLDGLEPDPRVLGFDRSQPEFVQTFDDYLKARVSEDRIRIARERFRQNRAVLDKIADAYNVDPEYMIAFWGLESSFGRYQGKYSVVRSLATLAYDPRRTTFFTKELLSALKILSEGHVPPDEFVGGWAGAMGQNQFLPSSFLNYAQDFNGDGRKNIWSEEVDVWASIANYLSKNGWRRDRGWGTTVTVPATLDVDSLKPEKTASGCTALRQHTRRLPVAEWKRLGVMGDLDRLTQSEYALVFPEEGTDVSYLVGGNFRSILSYNCANKYAVSVGLLSDLILRQSDQEATMRK